MSTKGFEHWDEAKVREHNARVQPANWVPQPCGDCDPCLSGRPDQCALFPARHKAAAVSESDLHDQILAEVRRRGWIAFHSRMDKRTTQACGIPDFVILGNRQSQYTVPQWNPFILLIEVKTRTGKLSPAQFAMKHHAEKLGHCIHVVRDMPQFLALCGTLVNREGE